MAEVATLLAARELAVSAGLGQAVEDISSSVSPVAALVLVSSLLVLALASTSMTVPGEAMLVEIGGRVVTTELDGWWCTGPDLHTWSLDCRHFL